MNYLLAISLGPVQEFIAAARRTADLSAGSQLLVEMAGRVAAQLHTAGAELIFPASVADDGPNKLLAVVAAEGDAEMRALVACCEADARSFLRDEWERQLSRHPDVACHVNVGLAKHQLEDFLELYAAWVPLGASVSQTRQDVDRLLAGRKALRDFGPDTGLDKGIPKSSLDPSRAAVLRLNLRECPQLGEAPYRFKSAESLDAVSLLKRLRGASLNGRNSVPDTDTMARRGVSQSDQPEGPEPLSERDFGYYAIVLADGDRMGEALAKLGTVPELQNFSRRLTTFAAAAKAVVERCHGYSIYVGGDDVLALVPAPAALACARELAREFAATMGTTLSAGIALVHYLEPLQTAIGFARDAERAAKGPRDAVAVALHTRGGSPSTVVTGWSDVANPDDWELWLEAMAQQLVHRGLPYQLAELAREFQGSGASNETLGLEARRVWKRQTGREREGIAEAAPELPDYAVTSPESLKAFAEKLVTARFLTRKELC